MTKYYVVDSEFNRAHNQKLIGSLIQEPTPSYVAVKAFEPLCLKVFKMMDSNLNQGSNMLSDKKLDRILIDELGLTMKLLQSLKIYWKQEKWSPSKMANRILFIRKLQTLNNFSDEKTN